MLYPVFRIIAGKSSMKEDIVVQEGITIPGHELEITASRSSGPGGQNVNKVSTRITIRWNVRDTDALTEEQKKRVLNTLKNEITEDGDLLIHESESRSQFQNKEKALKHLAARIKKALKVPKRRLKSTISRAVKESRLHAKKERSSVKRLRQRKFEE